MEMGKMLSRDVIWCLVFLFTLTSASVNKLNSINDLKKIKFGSSVPKHSLLLLHWFASIVDIDNNNVIWLTFEPGYGDYGGHHYGNFERMLPALPANSRYYTLGNVNQRTDLPLPSYVSRPPQNLVSYEERNRDRIIIRVRDVGLGNARIDRVYITQHYTANEHMGTIYDPAHTYQIGENLLRELREFSLESSEDSLSELRDHFGEHVDNSQLSNLKNKLGELACLGLLLLIVIHNVNLPQPKKQPRHDRAQPTFVNIPANQPSHLAINIPTPARLPLSPRDNMNLEVITGINGKASIVWSNIPVHILNQGVMVALFEDYWSTHPTTSKSIQDTEGSYDTTVSLNPGLQVRLHETSRWCCFWKVPGDEICRGGEFRNPAQIQVIGNDVKLQLCVKNGKACARLYIRKSVGDWRVNFKESWVGFYSSASKTVSQYEWWQWQWVRDFIPFHDPESLSHNVYEYQSSLTIAKGVQARFILRDQEILACTPVWT